MRFSALLLVRVSFAMSLGFAGSLSAYAQSSYPMLMGLHPVAVQAGQTSEHEINARYSMYGAFQVLVSGEGVTGEVVLPEEKEKPAKKPDMPKIKVLFTAAADALPGVRDFRLATPQGVSTVGQLVVVRDPVIAEAAKNNDAAGAQEVTLPVTICGTIETNEDVDFYRFRITEPASLSFHVRSARLEDRIHDLQEHVDPLVSIRNASGTILAQVDNYFYGDPLLNYRFETAGEYFLEIRDVRYKGNAYWHYSIEINDRPLITNVHPLAVAAGSETPLELIGFHLPADPHAMANVSADAAEGPQWLALPLESGPSNPAPVVVTKLPCLIETPEENGNVATAQLVQTPVCVSGRLEKTGDIDCFAFEAKKGEAFSIEVIARRHQSALDSVVRILNDQEKQLVENDDLSTGRHNFADSWIENWTAPADGRYIIEIRDLHLRGGPPFVYAVQVTRSRPYFTLEADTDKTVLTPGTAGAVFVRAYRKNGMTGEIQLSVDGLPPGVTAICGKILEDGRDGVIVLEAAKDAQLAAANVRISGVAEIPAKEGEPTETLTTVAGLLQETYMPGGGRGHYPVEMHTVGIAESLDIRSVTVDNAAVNLKPGESQKVVITIERAEGFDKNVTLDCLYRHLNSVYGDSLPKGVTIDAKNSKTLLTGKETQGHITLTAAKDAPPVEGQQIVMMANVSINFVMKMTYASPPLKVSVAAP